MPNPDKTATLVVCRQASDPLRPGFVYGHNCRFCDKPLQVSPDGVNAIAAGGWPTCNTCGRYAARMMQEHGKGVEFLHGPGAMDQLREWMQRGGLCV